MLTALFSAGVAPAQRESFERHSRHLSDFALAWRLIDRPPTEKPDEGDSNLETLIVRVDDGAVLAKSHAFYWELADKQAKGQYLRAAWSPDGHLLIRTSGRHGATDTAEIFAFGENDTVVGAFDLAKVLNDAVLVQMHSIQDADKYSFHFSYAPAVTIDDQGVIHASVFTEAPDSADGPIYVLTAQITHTANSLDAKVTSISQYKGPYVSVTVH